MRCGKSHRANHPRADDGDVNGPVAQFVLGKRHVRQEAERLKYRRRPQIADVGLGNLAIAIPGPDPVQYNG